MSCRAPSRPRGRCTRRVVSAESQQPARRMTRTWWCTVRSLAKCPTSAPRVHVTHPYNRVSITSAFNMRAFRLIGAVFLSYNSGPNRLKHAHMGRIRRSISSQRSAFSWMMPYQVPASLLSARKSPLRSGIRTHHKVKLLLIVCSSTRDSTYKHRISFGLPGACCLRVQL